MVRNSIFELPEGMEILADLALDLRWTWTHEGDRLWRMLKPDMWALSQNPWLILQSMSRSELDKVTSDPAFQEELKRLISARSEYIAKPGWFVETYPEGTLSPVAYFSMEYGLGEGLPLYAGGLGVLAGDYLKAASDLQVPLVAVGLLYQEGYFRQMLDGAGVQIEAFPYNDPTTLPIKPVFGSSGARLTVPLELPGRTVLLKTWQVQVGRVTLYLLDSNLPSNSPTDRGITNKLYDAHPDIRLMQEMALGIGGWRALTSMGIRPEICHLNEGHAAFVVLERTCDFMDKEHIPFAVAFRAARAGNIFSTHTPVAAGFDTFPPQLIARYLREFLRAANIPLEELLPLGRRDPGDPNEPFNMAYLAMRGSIRVNGVSRLHGKVSRRIFHPLFPRWPQEEVPVSHITNGVHVPSWDSREADELWTRAAGKARWMRALEHVAEAINGLSDKDIWGLRSRECQCLVDFVRQRLSTQLGQQGAEAQTVAEAQLVLDPNVLTIGFARRFTEYKRPNLILQDTERLIRMITDPKYPVQIVAAGKAHPQDEVGKRLVHEFVRFARQPLVRRRVVFLADYDIGTAEQLVQGVDLWLNTPRRPWEACGTSGMKVLANGGLNASELDGWWAEAYSPDVGWAIGNGQEHVAGEYDTKEAKALYSLLEKEIIPEFYDRDAEGIPVKWVARIRASMAKLAPYYSTNRMLREYVVNMYLPVTRYSRERLANGCEVARMIFEWQAALDRCWPDVRFGDLKVVESGSVWVFDVPVYIGDLKPENISVELYAQALDGEDAVRLPMALVAKIQGAVNAYHYRGEAPRSRPAEHYTPRIIPAHPAACVPLEEAHILWQR